MLSVIIKLVVLQILVYPSFNYELSVFSDPRKAYPLHVITRLKPNNDSSKLQGNRKIAVYPSKLFSIGSTVNKTSTKKPQIQQFSVRAENGARSKYERDLQINLRKNPLVVTEHDKSFYKNVHKEPTDDKQVPDGSKIFAKLSSLIDRAAKIAIIFQKFAKDSQRRIRRKESPLRISKAFDPGQRKSGKPLIGYSHDETIYKIQKDEPQVKSSALENFEWAELLLGPRGVLAAVFHILDDRRKITDKINTDHSSGTTASYHQSDLSLLPDFLVNAKPIDFAKIFEAFLTGKGDFAEKISNLPELLGICNRLSCGDIYKAIDEFRKSDFFINFQTALQLIQDPQGWEILGELITNPELIAQFVGGDGDLSNIFGGLKKKTKTKKISNKTGTEIGPDDGDLGVDFSKMAGKEKEKKPTAEELPEIAENIDSENIDAIDYYNAVEGEFVEGGEVETIVKPDEKAPLAIERSRTVASTTKRALKSSTFANSFSRKPNIISANKVPLAKNLPPDIMFPEISESIDEVDHTEAVIDSTIPDRWKKNGRVVTNTYKNVTYQPYAKATSTVSRTRYPYSTSQTKYPYRTVSQTSSPYRTVTQPKYFYRTTTDRPVIHMTTRWYTTTTRKATTKNFREESDYYAMYYDDH